MPLFTVKTTRAYYAVVTYQVEADDEDEARDKVKFDDVPEIGLTSPDWDGEEEFMDAYLA